MPPVERKIYPYRKWTVAAAAVILLALGSSVSLYFLGLLLLMKYVIPNSGISHLYRMYCRMRSNRMCKEQRRTGSASGSEEPHGESRTEQIPQPTANIDEPVKNEDKLRQQMNARPAKRKEKEDKPGGRDKCHPA